MSASYIMGTSPLSEGQSGRGMALNTRFQLEPRLRTSHTSALSLCLRGVTKRHYRTSVEGLHRKFTSHFEYHL
jgi:hypothetical protein